MRAARRRCGDTQARKLLEAPAADTLKGARDRAILATLLYHGMRARSSAGCRPGHAEPSGRGAFSSQGKRAKIRFVPVHAMAQRLIEEYLAVAGHGADAGISPLPPGDEQPHGGARPAARSRLGLSQHRPEIRARNRRQRACIPCATATTTSEKPDGCEPSNERK
jgi:integrase